MSYPAGLKYTKDHEWIKVEGNIGTIGVTFHAQSELGDVVYVDINENKKDLSIGDEFGTIEAVKTVADLYTPVSGKVVEINNNINDNPEVVNQDCYGGGWMIKIELTNLSELDELMDSESYSSYVGH